MSFGPLHDISRNVCFLEDVSSDSAAAWTLLTTFYAITRSDVEVIAFDRARVQQVVEALSRLEADMGRLVENAARVRT